MYAINICTKEKKCDFFSKKLWSVNLLVYIEVVDKPSVDNFFGR
nr:MAG TPA: hypothetical protein [Caudoviricetes sp.]